MVVLQLFDKQEQRTVCVVIMKNLTWHELFGHGLDCDSGAPLISIFIVPGLIAFQKRD